MGARRKLAACRLPDSRIGHVGGWPRKAGRGGRVSAPGRLLRRIASTGRAHRITRQGCRARVHFARG